MAATATRLEPKLRAALEEAIEALRRMAEYKLEPELDARMRKLGENKDTCSPQERDEYTAWVEFWQNRTLDKLTAINALQGLRAALPDFESLPGPKYFRELSKKS